MAKKSENYEKLKNKIEEFGEWELNYSKLAREWQMPVRTIHNWKNKIVEELGPLDLTSARKNVPMILKSNIKLFQRLIRKSDYAKDKAVSARALNHTIKTLTEFAEAHGIKEKVPDKHEITGIRLIIEEPDKKEEEKEDNE